MAIGVLAVITLVIVSMIENQQKSVRSISEKMSIQDLETQIRTALSSANYCSCLLRGKTFNTTVPMSLSPGVGSLPTGYTMPPPAPPTACTPLAESLVAGVGSPFLNSAIRVNGLDVGNFVDMGGGLYSANLIVSLDGATLITPRKPILVPFSFSVDTTMGTPTARPFLQCSRRPFSGVRISQGSSIVVPAGSCPGGILVSANMRVENGDSWYSQPWATFTILDNGLTLGNLILSGGKTGGTGHFWRYRHDISKTFFIGTVGIDHTIEAQPVVLAGGSIVEGAPNEPHIIVTCF